MIGPEGKKYDTWNCDVHLMKRENSDEKEINVDEDSCEKDFNGISVGNRCEGIRHCIFDAFTRDGKCLGLDLGVSAEGPDLTTIKNDCEQYCAETRDMTDPLSSRYCTVKFPIRLQDETGIVNTNCYDPPINVRCGVNCKTAALIPQE